MLYYFITIFPVALNYILLSSFALSSCYILSSSDLGGYLKWSHLRAATHYTQSHCGRQSSNHTALVASVVEWQSSHVASPSQATSPPQGSVNRVKINRPTLMCWKRNWSFDCDIINNTVQYLYNFFSPTRASIVPSPQPFSLPNLVFFLPL